MFRGLNAVNLDPKGRFAVPTRYRKPLAELCTGQMVATIDTHAKCLLLYPLPEWELIEEKLLKLPSFKASGRRIQRLLIGHATDLELDAQGRLLVPPLLREYAELDKKLMLVGQSNKFEIWDEVTWQARRDAWLKEESSSEGLPDELETFFL